MKHPYSRFIILSTFRSGTHHLSDLLNSHPNIIAYGQVFNRSLYRKPALWETLRRIAPSVYLGKRIFKAYPEDIRAVGYCLMYDQIEQLKSSHPILKDIHGHDYNIIHLTRKNMLRTCVSMQIALKTGVWKTTRQAPIPRHTLLINPHECEAFFRQVTLYESKYANYFKSHRMLHVTYEQLASEPNPTLRGIQRFLSVDEQPLVSKYRKQATQTLRQTILNYETLKEYFKMTRWRSFFTE